METLKDLVKYNQEASRILKRWESDAEFRKQRTITKHLNGLNKYVSRHIALQYYLLDNYITIKGDGPMSLFEAFKKLELLKSIRKVASKMEESDKVQQLNPAIKEYENKIEKKLRSTKLIKPSE